MGTSYQFRCLECRYEAEVSRGTDAGMRCTTVTIHCLTCQELYDVISAVMAEDYSSFTPKKVRCPKSARHHWENWQHPGPCPVCAQPLTKGEIMVLWD